MSIRLNLRLTIFKIFCNILTESTGFNLVCLGVNFGRGYRGNDSFTGCLTRYHLSSGGYVWTPFLSRAPLRIFKDLTGAFPGIGEFRDSR